jgi:hypothetical protein
VTRRVSTFRFTVIVSLLESYLKITVVVNLICGTGKTVPSIKHQVMNMYGCMEVQLHTLSLGSRQE